jgi:hypothetical protein
MSKDAKTPSQRAQMAAPTRRMKAARPVEAPETGEAHVPLSPVPPAPPAASETYVVRHERGEERCVTLFSAIVSALSTTAGDPAAVYVCDVVVCTVARGVFWDGAREISLAEVMTRAKAITAAEGRPR